MKKREQGVLTVDSSIVLVIFTFFVLFLFNFARVYRAQSLVSHAAIESADAVALESHLREVAFESDVRDVVYLASHLSGSAAISADSLESLRTANIPRIAKEKFVSAIAGSDTAADNKLRAAGIKDGLDGIDFSQSRIVANEDDVLVYLNYVIELQYPVFGARELRVTKAAKAKTFGDILYSVTTESNNNLFLFRICRLLSRK